MIFSWKYNYGNIANPNVYYCYYTERSLKLFRRAFQATIEELVRLKDIEKADALAKKYFTDLMFSTGYEDQFSIPILKSYSRVNPIAAEKIIDEMINEYLIQISHLASLGRD